MIGDLITIGVIASVGFKMWALRPLCFVLGHKFRDAIVCLRCDRCGTIK